MHLKKNLPTEITMALESAVPAQSNLIQFDTDDVFVNTWQPSAIPYNARDYQVTAVKSFDSPT